MVVLKKKIIPEGPINGMVLLVIRWGHTCLQVSAQAFEGQQTSSADSTGYIKLSTTGITNFVKSLSTEMI